MTALMTTPSVADTTTLTAAPSRPLPPALTTIATPRCGVLFSSRIGEAPASCFPPEWERYLAAGGYYSPGICPKGYTLGCGAPRTLAPLESAYFCAPLGYACLNQGNSTVVGASALANTQTGRTFTSYQTAALIEIRWKTSDLAVLETDPIHATAPSAPMPPGRVSQRDIAIIVVLPVAAFVGFIWFCVYSRRRHRRWASKQPPGVRALGIGMTRPTRRDVEMQRMTRRRRRAPVFRHRDEDDPPPAYDVDNPVMSPHLTELENLQARMDELERNKRAPGAVLLDIEVEQTRLRQRIAELKNSDGQRVEPMASSALGTVSPTRATPTSSSPSPSPAMREAPPALRTPVPVMTVASASSTTRGTSATSGARVGAATVAGESSDVPPISRGGLGDQNGPSPSTWS